MIDVSSWDTSNVTNMSNMFYECDGLTNLNLSNFNTSLVSDMYQMFAWCTSLTILNLNNATFTSVTSYSSMLCGIDDGIAIYVKDSAAQTFINAILNDEYITGTVTIG